MTADVAVFAGLSRLVVRRPVEAKPEAILRVMAAPAAGWLGAEVDTAPPGLRRFATDLELDAGGLGRRLRFRKAAYVDLGVPRSIGTGWEVELGWRASTLAPLFPVFSGSLLVKEGELSLSGWYAPPGGELGRLADAALLRLAARGTGSWFLRELEVQAEHQA